MNVTKRLSHWLLVGATAALLAIPAFAADGDRSTIKGLITAIQGDTITVRDGNNRDTTVYLLPSTTYKMKKGLMGARFETVQRSSLITGLPVTVDMVAAGSGYNATGISYESEEFRNAQQVQAGLETTRTGLATAEQRIDDFGTYEALATVEVLFDTGSSAISAAGESDLMGLVARTRDLKDYRIVVQGFTDSTGSVATNQRLSKSRAGAVTDFLQQRGGVSPGRVQAGDGMGIAADAGTGSNASARKVVVRLVVDKGVHGGTN